MINKRTKIWVKLVKGPFEKRCV